MFKSKSVGVAAYEAVLEFDKPILNLPDVADGFTNTLAANVVLFPTLVKYPAVASVTFNKNE